jgi:hypothetical protein
MAVGVGLGFREARREGVDSRPELVRFASCLLPLIHAACDRRISAASASWSTGGEK